MRWQSSWRERFELSMERFDPGLEGTTPFRWLLAVGVFVTAVPCLLVWDWYNDRRGRR